MNTKNNNQKIELFSFPFVMKKIIIVTDKSNRKYLIEDATLEEVHGYVNDRKNASLMLKSYRLSIPNEWLTVEERIVDDDWEIYKALKRQVDSISRSLSDFRNNGSKKSIGVTVAITQ